MAKLLDYIQPENPPVNHVLRKSLGYPSVTKATVRPWCQNTIILEKLQDSYCLLVGLRAINTVRTVSSADKKDDGILKIQRLKVASTRQKQRGCSCHDEQETGMAATGVASRKVTFPTA